MLRFFQWQVLIHCAILRFSDQNICLSPPPMVRKFERKNNNNNNSLNHSLGYSEPLGAPQIMYNYIRIRIKEIKSRSIASTNDRRGRVERISKSGASSPFFSLVPLILFLLRFAFSIVTALAAFLPIRSSSSTDGAHPRFRRYDDMLIFCCIIVSSEAGPHRRALFLFRVGHDDSVL